jgi:hypothetical protein
MTDNQAAKKSGKTLYWVTIGWMVALAKPLWVVLKKVGRIVLWIVLLPVGLWRSIVHGRKKRDRRLLERLRKEQRP